MVSRRAEFRSIDINFYCAIIRFILCCNQLKTLKFFSGKFLCSQLNLIRFCGWCETSLLKLKISLMTWNNFLFPDNKKTSDVQLRIKESCLLLSAIIVRLIKPFSARVFRLSACFLFIDLSSQFTIKEIRHRMPRLLALLSGDRLIALEFNFFLFWRKLS